MKIREMIRELQEQRDRIDRCIQSLAQIEAYDLKSNGLEVNEPKRRGRKFMGEAERLVVSARMKRYWANRAAEKRKELQKK